MIVIPLNEQHQPAGICGWFASSDNRYHCTLTVDDVDEDTEVTVMLEVEGVRGPGDNAEWVWRRTQIEGVMFQFHGKELTLRRWADTDEIVWNDDIRDAMENEYQKDRELEMETGLGIR